MLRELGPIQRVLFLATIGAALVGVFLYLVLHVDPTVLFIVSAIGILGLAWVVGLSTERSDQRAASPERAFSTALWESRTSAVSRT